MLSLGKYIERAPISFRRLLSLRTKNSRPLCLRLNSFAKLEISFMLASMTDNILENKFVQRLEALNSKIAIAAKNSGRNPKEIELVAVTKTQSNENIDKIIKAGQKVFGENKIQEGKFHFEQRDCESLELRFIGPLQSNKALQAVQLFDVIETLDRESLAKEIAKSIQKLGISPKFLVEINIGEEEQKAGIAPKELNAFLKLLENTYSLKPIGLMCIPPFGENPEPYFSKMNILGQDFGISQLSMGMSADFETAIKYGATHVRIGTALFGERIISPQNIGHTSLVNEV